jgi:Fic-DOC domain mobile mystery protein B
VAEFENISRALPWAEREAARRSSAEILKMDFLFELHRRMFGRVWKWAGTQRSRETNIGVAPHTITENTQLALGDALFWHEHDTYPLEERAARLHVRLVSVHPFTNGNGRCTRLLADLYLATCGEAPFSWGMSRLEADGVARADYLAALRAADAGDFGPLVRFARR